MNNHDFGFVQEPFPIETALLDGTPVLLRPVQPEDKPLLKSAIHNLSSEDRYNRFFQPVNTLTDDMLRKFTEIDHVDEEAIGALDISKSPVAPLGIVRYVREPENRMIAEIAVTIVSGYHGRGLGSLLLATLAKRAIENDIECFSAVVLDGNVKMKKLLDQLDPISKVNSKGIVNYRIALHKNPKDYPKTPVGEIFRDVSNESLFRRTC